MIADWSNWRVEPTVSQFAPFTPAILFILALAHILLFAAVSDRLAVWIGSRSGSLARTSNFIRLFRLSESRGQNWRRRADIWMEAGEMGRIFKPCSFLTLWWAWRCWRDGLESEQILLTKNIFFVFRWCVIEHQPTSQEHVVSVKVSHSHQLCHTTH